MFPKGTPVWSKKEAATEWEPVVKQNLKVAKEVVVKGKVGGDSAYNDGEGSNFDKKLETPLEWRVRWERESSFFATESNDITSNQKELGVDYIDDGYTDERYRWTNWSSNPEGKEVSWVIYQKDGNILEKTSDHTQGPILCW